MYIEQSVMVEAMCMLGQNYDYLLEAYAGRQKQLTKCESYLSHIVDELNKEEKEKNLGKTFSYKKQVSKDYEWNKKLENELADFFKVNSVNIWWMSGAGPNAFTLSPIQVFTFYNKNNYLAKMKSNANIDICIYEECVSVCGLTAEELMAVILHEIGHNFYYCPITNGLQIFYIVMTFPIGALRSLITKIAYKGKFIIDDALKKYFPVLYNIIQWFNRVMFETTQFLAPLTITLYALNTATHMSDPVNYIIDALTGYGNENGADSMCAKYGYAEAQVSALRKLDDPENTIYGKMERNDTSGFMGFNHDLTQLALECISMISGDPHPNSNQRAANMLKKLKRDLATGDYPSGMKKDLEKEINNMEKILEVCSENSSPSSLQIRRDWYNTLNYIFNNNSDFRQIFAFYFDSFRF